MVVVVVVVLVVVVVVVVVVASAVLLVVLVDVPGWSLGVAGPLMRTKPMLFLGEPDDALLSARAPMPEDRRDNKGLAFPGDELERLLGEFADDEESGSRDNGKGGMSGGLERTGGDRGGVLLALMKFLLK